MRVRLRHETSFTWDRPVRGVLMSLRLTPRDHEAQHVVDWRVGTDVDCRLAAQEDAFGNLAHSCAAEGPLTSLTLSVEGHVLTSDLAGVVRHTPERFPPELYLRDTPASAADPELRAFAEAEAGEGTSLDRLHRLMGAVHARMTLDEAQADVGAAAAFASRQGSRADIVHVLLACLRHVEIPARFASGYFVDAGEIVEHAWAEGHAEGFGGIGFDPLLDLCPQEAHLRVAIGLDALGAMPVRCAVTGFAASRIAARLELVGAPARGWQQQ